MKNFISELKDIKINNLLTNGSVILGLDIGDKTVGVSVSDRRLQIATGVSTIQRINTKRDFVQLKESVNRYKIRCIIFGWPVQMNGQPGPQCEKTLEFVEELKEYFENTSFSYWDERFSTSAVTNILITADLSRKKRKKVIDKNAAVYILQGALDFLNRTQKNSCPNF